MTDIPVLKLGPVLFLTVPETLNDAQAKSLEESVLVQLERTRATAVVIDITSMEIIDSFMARVIAETAQAARIMDARVVVVGMSPVATITLLELGLDMEGITTAMDLEAGLVRLGYKLVSVNSSTDLRALPAEGDKT